MFKFRNQNINVKVLCKMVKFSAIIFLFFCMEFPNSFAQDRHDLSCGVIYISNFIASDYFSSLKSDTNDVALLDTLFQRSYDYYNGDISESLLTLTFAGLPYSKMPLKIPVVNVRIDIPLPSVKDAIFEIKKNNLPSQLLFDSPHSEFGDKDKISHFFGNAFLSYNVSIISIINFAKFASIYIELFESAFEVEGAVSLRDLRVNQLGEFFGAALKNNDNIKPSSFFAMYGLYFVIF